MPDTCETVLTHLGYDPPVYGAGALAMAGNFTPN
jgi:hypothetical protein